MKGPSTKPFPIEELQGNGIVHLAYFSNFSELDDKTVGYEMTICGLTFDGGTWQYVSNPTTCVLCIGVS